MSTHKEPKPSCKVWLEYNGKPLLGKGGAEILERIEKEQSLSKAAKELGMSYRYLWNYIKRMEKTVGAPVIETFRGGRAGGGGAKLTALGKSLLQDYRLVGGYLEEILSGMQHGIYRLQMGAEKPLLGTVKAIKRKGKTAEITVEVKPPIAVTAFVSDEKAEELELKVGDNVEIWVRTWDLIIKKGKMATQPHICR